MRRHAANGDIGFCESPRRWWRSTYPKRPATPCASKCPNTQAAEKFNWEEKVIRVLAKCALENGSKGDKAVFTRIRDRARVLSLVPEKLWAEISWTDEGE
jgi:hypothetical protein